MGHAGPESRMKKPRKTSAQSFNDAKAAGRAAAGTDQRNTYKPGTQCWILFNLERDKAEAAAKAAS